MHEAEDALRILFDRTDIMVAMPDVEESEIITGTYEEILPQVERLRFFCRQPIEPNTTKKPTTNAAISKCRTFSFEFDGPALSWQDQRWRSLALKPSLVVYSGNKSLHVHYCLDEAIDIETYKRLAKRFLEIFPGSDPRMKTPCQKVRMPEAIRDNGNRQEVKYIGRRYSLEEIKEFTAVPRSGNWKNNLSAVVKKLGVEIGVEYEERATCKAICHEDHNPSAVIFKDGGYHCASCQINTWLWGTGDKATDPKKFTLKELADDFISKHLVVFWNGRFLDFNGKNYRFVDSRYVESRIYKYLLKHHEEDARDKLVLTQKLLKHVELSGMLDDVEPQTKIEGDDGRRFISMQNGLFNIDLYLATGEVAIEPHSPNFFTLYTLPFDMEVDAECDNWWEFLHSSVKDEESIEFLQEWFGYNLIPETKYDTALFCIGRGANGKSVMTTVFRTLLGKDNVSHMDFGGFGERSKFALAETDGKLANITEEISEMTKVSEGKIKQFITGEPCLVERKNERPFTMTPTARLTVTCNILPRVHDYSDGFMRRIIVMPWNIQIAKEEQNREMKSIAYWQPEMAGIMLWALDGLRRLENRGRFEEPMECRKERERYRLECNPAAMFLRQHCEENPNAWDDTKKTVGGSDAVRLYSMYCDWSSSMGLGNRGFQSFVRVVEMEFTCVKLDFPALSNGVADGPIFLRLALKDGVSLPNNKDLGGLL